MFLLHKAEAIRATKSEARRPNNLVKSVKRDRKRRFFKGFSGPRPKRSKVRTKEVFRFKKEGLFARSVIFESTERNAKDNKHDNRRQCLVGYFTGIL